MAIRAGKKLPDKRGFVDGPGGYRGRDDRSHGSDSNGSGSSSGSGGGGNFNTNTTPGNELSAMDQMAEAANVANEMAGAGYVKKNFNLTNDPLSNYQQSMALNAPGLDPTVPNALFGTNPNYSMQAPNPNLAAENAAPEEFQGFPALFSGIVDAVGGFMNSPIGNAVGMFTNPLGYIGGQALKNIYGAYNDEDEDTGIMSALGNTYQQSTPFGEMSTAIGNPFSGVPNAGELNTTTEVGDTFSMPKQSFVNSLFTNQNYELSPEAQAGMPSTVGVGQRLNANGTINTGMANDAFEDYNNQLAAKKQPGFFGNLFSGLDIQPNDLEAERLAFRADKNKGPIIPLPGDPDYVTPLPDPRYGTGGTPLPIGFGSINPAANYGLLYGGGFANGGQVPPMSGPMSNGIGTLYKQK